jgi:hypothetical protein
VTDAQQLRAELANDPNLTDAAREELLHVLLGLSPRTAMQRALSAAYMRGFMHGQHQSLLNHGHPKDT